MGGGEQGQPLTEITEEAEVAGSHREAEKRRAPGSSSVPPFLCVARKPFPRCGIRLTPILNRDNKLYAIRVEVSQIQGFATQSDAEKLPVAGNG